MSFFSTNNLKGLAFIEQSKNKYKQLDEFCCAYFLIISFSGIHRGIVNYLAPVLNTFYLQNYLRGFDIYPLIVMSTLFFLHVDECTDRNNQHNMFTFTLLLLHVLLLMRVLNMCDPLAVNCQDRRDSFFADFLSETNKN